jgi:hypothetical protein
LNILDQHREELKKKIDDIALDMIRNTEKYEKIYLSSLKEKVTENFSSSFHVSKSLENGLNVIEDMFRNPNLLIASIRDMQRKQEESFNEIQSKLNRMNQVKDDFKKQQMNSNQIYLCSIKKKTRLYSAQLN